MSASQSNIDELLSGFLDGKLSAEEHCQLNALFEAEPALRLQLSSLQQMRADLQGIPKQSLGIDFSARVIEAARREALRSRLPSEHHVLAGVRPKPTSNTTLWESPGKMVGILAALAASIVLLTFVVKESLRRGPSNDQIAISEVEEDASNQDSGDKHVDASPFPAHLATNDVTPEGRAEIETGIEPKSELPVRNSPASRKAIQLLLIYDLKITQQAWDSNVLGTILENCGIRWSDPIFASAQVTSSLAKTRSIFQGSRKEELQEDVALILVSASAKAVDKAMLEIWQRAKDFPLTALDIAFDLPDQDLLRNLNDAIANADSEQSARPLILTSSAGVGLDDVAQFSTRAKFISSDDRHSVPSAAPLGTEEDAPSYALLVVRKPSKQ